ncbi:hypothetical protein ACQEU5_06165 [Marinactinospora thermotolerans]|uniref:Uncharacterized protein n=1 Tax=Marinactinospora thermotolerans DSM 45154 TaxID=1122192 RepID=A0A1T4STC4_9ACTN|nr:hypothetical protein [Marinactinospora thermotolerans]SKA31417.1 hypothetical protein SAMN02745673_03954 [Marinactinospora thermotolerans DSM 45154]
MPAHGRDVGDRSGRPALGRTGQHAGTKNYGDSDTGRPATALLARGAAGPPSDASTAIPP